MSTVMITRLVLFGATGDLAGRYLLPALAALYAAGELSDGFQVVGAARQHLDEEAFRRLAVEQLERYAADVPVEARHALVRSLRYLQVDVTNPTDLAAVLTAGTGPVATYLALPPNLYPAAITALRRTGLPAGSRIVLEKPFGEDLDGAIALNRLLAQATGATGERAVFRVDHVLGMATVQNLLGLRLANTVLGAVWNSAHIEQVDILWEETLALEGRAGYYDRTGALKDVLQNHMLQVLCLIAMEPPAGLGEQDLQDRKVDVLRAVRPPLRSEMAARTRRARYTAGRLAEDPDGGGRRVPAYTEEAGVDAQRETETFAETVFELDNHRWAGTPFLLRAGKALSRRRKMAVVRFRPVPHPPFDDTSPPPAVANELRIGLDGPEDITLTLTGSAPGLPSRPRPLTLTASAPRDGLPAYSRVLLDVLNGGSTLSVRGDEAEQAWRVVTPVLTAWADGLVPLQEYPAGSAGPPPLDGVTSRRPGTGAARREATRMRPS
jgi:glucose-6-phosphate 1-dehydrogenase